MEEIKWLWKKTSTESYCEPYSLSYQLTIVTREHLIEVQITRTLSHLFRKVPLLRTCFGERDGEVWLREMSHELIDFEVIPDARGNDLHHKLHTYNYNKDTGPLWCVKLRPEPHCLPDGVSREKIPGFPHMYSIFLGINHAITDGTTNVKICGFLLQILDDIIAGKPVDEKQLGIFMPNDKIEELIRQQEAVIKCDSVLKQQLIEEYKVLQGKRSFVKSLLRGGGGKAKSKIISRDLDLEATAAFTKSCRAEGVTVNSAFTAVASLAVVDIIAEAGLKQESYDIRSDHVINARKYWENDSSQCLGCHVLSLTPITVKTPRRVGPGFWNYAKSVNDKLHKKVMSVKPLQEEVIKRLGLPGPDPAFEFEFFVTNMGEITKLIGEGGNHVQLTHLVRTGAIDSVPCPFLYHVHTFRGRLVPTLIYNSSLVTSDVAERLYERVFHYFSSAT